AADQLRVLAGSAELAKERHLGVHAVNGVLTVDADAVGLAGVIARGAGEVAPGEHTVGPLAAGRPAAEHLTAGLDVRGQLVPPAAQRSAQVGMLGSGEDVKAAEALA